MSKKDTNLIEHITNKVKALFAETEDVKAEDEKKTEMVEAVVKDTGVTIKADNWDEGTVVTAITEEGDEITLPEGSYEIEDGTVITVDTEGKILEVVAPAEVEVEVDAEKDKEKMNAEPKYVTEQDFTAAMSEMTKALERVSTKLSAIQKPAKEDENDPEKVVAQNKLLKQRLAEKRKSIADKSEKEKKNDPLPEKFGKTNRGHVSGSKQRVANKFKDFDFTMEKSNEPVEL